MVDVRAVAIARKLVTALLTSQLRWMANYHHYCMFTSTHVQVVAVETALVAKLNVMLSVWEHKKLWKNHPCINNHTQEGSC